MYRPDDLSPFAEVCPDAPRPSIRAACALYFAAVVGLVTTGLLSGVFANWPGASRYLSAAFDIGVVLVPVLRYLQKHPGMDETVRLRYPSAPAALFVLPTALVGVFFVNALGTLWLLLLEALGGTLTAVSTPYETIFEALVFGALMPGVCEEILCRGVLLSAWERRGRTRALLVSAALFTVLHASIEGLPTQFMLGMALGWIVLKTGSLFTGMLYHAVHNAVIYLLAARGAADEAAAPLIEQIGGAPGVCALVGFCLLLGGVYALLLRAFGRLRSCPPASRLPLDKTPMDTPAFFMLAAALVTVAALYALAIFAMAGVLG